MDARSKLREWLRGWWHRWIVADDEYSALLDKWDREAGHRFECPGCGLKYNGIHCFGCGWDHRE